MGEVVDLSGRMHHDKLLGGRRTCGYFRCRRSSGRSSCVGVARCGGCGRLRRGRRDPVRAVWHGRLMLLLDGVGGIEWNAAAAADVVGGCCGGRGGTGAGHDGTVTAAAGGCGDRSGSFR